MDEQLINDTGDMLDAGLRFTQQRSADGTQLAPLLLSSRETPGRPGSSGHSEFSFHMRTFDGAMQAVLRRWDTLVRETEGNPDQGDMITAFLNQDEWSDGVRAAYDASTPLVSVLSDDRKAPALIAKRHLASLMEFRAGAENLLGIEPGQQVGSPPG